MTITVETQHKKCRTVYSFSHRSKFSVRIGMLFTKADLTNGKIIGGKIQKFIY